MVTTVEWVQKPHIIQITYQGKLTLEEIVEAWNRLEAQYQEHQPSPYCLLATILPDRTLPIGITGLMNHPAANIVQYLDAVAVSGIDHFLLGIILESMTRANKNLTIYQTENHEEALQFLQEYVTTYQSDA